MSNSRQVESDLDADLSGYKNELEQLREQLAEKDVEIAELKSRKLVLRTESEQLDEMRSVLDLAKDALLDDRSRYGSNTTSYDKAMALRRKAINAIDAIKSESDDDPTCPTCGRECIEAESNWFCEHCESEEQPCPTTTTP